MIRLSSETHYMGLPGCRRIGKYIKNPNTEGWRYRSVSEVLVVRAQGLEFGSPAPTKKAGVVTYVYNPRAGARVEG